MRCARKCANWKKFVKKGDNLTKLTYFKAFCISTLVGELFFVRFTMYVAGYVYPT